MLRQGLVDLVSNGILTVNSDADSKNPSYSLSNTNGPSNSNNGKANLTITVSLDIGHKGLLDALLSFLNGNTSSSTSGEGSTAVLADEFLPDDLSGLVDDADKAANEEEYIDDPNELPF